MSGPTPSTTLGARVEAKVRGTAEDLVAAWRTMRGGRLPLAAHLLHERASVLRSPWSGRAAEVRSRSGTSIRYRANPGDVRSLREVWFDDVYRLPAHWQPRTVLDLGANIGLTSLWYHQQWPEARFVLVEPDPANVALARRNVDENGVLGTVVAAAVGPEVGSASFSSDAASNLGHLRAEGDGPAEGDHTVEVITVDLLLPLLGGHADLVKLDVEGGEAAILGEQTGGWLEHVGVLVAEFHPPQVDYAALVAGIVRRGFVHFPPNTLRPRSTDLFFHPDRVAAIDGWMDRWSAAQHQGGGSQHVACRPGR